MPILQQIDGFDNYNFKSRDYRTQMLSHESSDKNEDVMVFRRSNFTLYCEEFLSKVPLTKNSNKYVVLLKFQLDKPLGYQLLFSNDYNLDAAGYYSIELSKFNPYYSLFNNACVDESTHIALSNLYKSLIEIFDSNIRLLVDNDVICLYYYSKSNNFEIKVTDSDYEAKLKSDFKLLNQIMDAADLIDSFTKDKYSLIVPKPSTDMMIEDVLTSDIKEITSKSSRFIRIMVVVIVILLIIFSYLLLFKIAVWMEDGGPMNIWWMGGLFVLLSIPLYTSRLLNFFIPKKIFKTIGERFNRTFVKFRRRRQKKNKNTKIFKFFKSDYFKANSAVCKFDNYNLYLFNDECFTGTLMEFEFNTRILEDVALIVNNSEMKIVLGATNTVIDNRIKDCILAVLDYLHSFNPSLSLNVVLQRNLVQIYVPSSGYVDLRMGLFEKPDYELTAQNAVQISRMIRAADKFVDSYNNLNIATR
ncbi:MAG: hypothetical protein J5826_01640 [Bacteroidales bacterium]|nr:hypothetical protein [Bacteroidales bacterium]